ncbi:MAG: PEGA domain-containing protein [Methanoregula sp.]|nr:PEGA domain-containing protein [Methanoregula sp.]
MNLRNTIAFICLLLVAVTIFIPYAAAEQTCILSVTSIPDKGIISIDGRQQGTTPLGLSLPCGNYTLEIAKNGYLPYKTAVLLRDDEHRNIVANLQRLADRGHVTIRTEPPGGDLYVDGKSRGVTPLTVDNLLPGRHEILIRRMGYEDYHDVISVATDITTEYTEYLVPLPGTGFLSVTSSPEGADVRIDGIEFGKTPTNLQRIGVGNHTVDIFKSGYWNFTRIVNIKGGESRLAKADLTKIPTSCTLYLDSSPQGLKIYLNDTFKGFTPLTFDRVPSGDYVLEFRLQNGLPVNQSFRFMPGASYDIFAVLDNETGGSIVNREWEYRNESSMMNQPGWMSVNATPVIERQFTWYTNGQEATITLDIPQDLYDYYKGLPHPTSVSSDTFSHYAINERDRQYLHTLVNRLKDASEFKSYRARNDYRNVVAFVQSIAYADDIDPVTRQKTEYWKYPIETLADGNGDCEDTAILTAALLKEMGYDVAVVLLPEHAAVAVACNNCNGYYYPLDGKRYYYLETTGAGFSPGTMDVKYQASSARLIPI